MVSNAEIVAAYDALHQLSEKIDALDSALLDMREASDTEMYDPPLIYRCLLDLEECRQAFTSNKLLLHERFAGLVRAYKMLQNDYIDLFIKLNPDAAQPLLDEVFRAAMVTLYLHPLNAADQDVFVKMFMDMYHGTLPIETHTAIRAILGELREVQMQNDLSGLHRLSG